MTITFHAGRRIQGLSTDYVPAITDVSDSNWTVTGSDYAINSGVIDWEGVRSSSVKGIHIDLGVGNISDTKWVLRFKMVTDASSVGTSGSNILYIAVSDAGVQPQWTGSEDSLGYYERSHSGGAHKQTVGYGDEQNLLENVDDFNTNNPSTGTKYIEMKRTSATSFTVTRYSDEFVTTLETAKTITIPSTVQSLRYIKIQNKEETPAGGTFNGTISDVQFWNDVTTAGVPILDYLENVQSGSRFEETDTRKIYYGTPSNLSDSTLNSTDGTTGWDMTNAGSDISLDTSNNEVDFNSTTGAKSCYYDLGANISESWVLRFATTWSGAGSNNPIYWIGVSNTQTIVSNSTSIKGVFFTFYGGSTFKIGVANNQRIDQNTQNTLSPATTCNATPYWVEIIKNGSTSMTVSIYPNSSYGTATATYTHNANLSGLRYMNGITYIQGSGTTGTFSDVKFYNGVTTPNDSFTWTEES